MFKLLTWFILIKTMDRVVPKDFLGERPPDRIIGVECEYNLQNRLPNRSSYTPAIDLSHYMSAEVLKRVGLKSHGSFLSNGGKIYEDCGNLLEYGTPECLGPKQASAADLAGILILKDAITASKVPHNGLYRLTGSSVVTSKNPPSNKTSGTHENYLLPRAISNNSTIERLLPGYLATRLFAMSGMVSNSYQFSQKVEGIGGAPAERNLSRRTIHGQKPMFIIPSADADQDTIGNKLWSRVEVRFADAPISPRANFMRLAITSLIIRLAEHPDLIDPHLFEFVELNDPVSAAKGFSKDLSLKTTVETKAHKTVGLINIQEAYAQSVSKLSQKVQLPDDELQALDLWQEFCDDLKLANPVEADYGRLLKQYDFAARHFYLMSKHKPDSITSQNPQAVQESLVWDRVLPNGGGLTFWNRVNDPIIDPSSINDLKHIPPRTRARLRGAIIRSAHPFYKVKSWSILQDNANGLHILPDSYQASIR